MRTVSFRLATSADDSRDIEFPAEHLRQFVLHDGINGWFELVFDEGNKFVGLQRI